MPRSRTPSLSSSGEDRSGTATPIAIVQADREDKQILGDLRKLIASRLMNAWRYESLVEALEDEPDRNLIKRLKASRDIAQTLYKQASDDVKRNALVRHYNRANPDGTFGSLIRIDAAIIDTDIAESSGEKVHWTNQVRSYLEEVISQWKPIVPFNETDETREAKKARVVMEREAIAGAYGIPPLSHQENEDYYRAERIRADKRRLIKLQAERANLELEENQRVQRNIMATLLSASSTHPSDTPRLEPQQPPREADSPIPLTALPAHVLSESRPSSRSPSPSGPARGRSPALSGSERGRSPAQRATIGQSVPSSSGYRYSSPSSIDERRREAGSG